MPIVEQQRLREAGVDCGANLAAELRRVHWDAVDWSQRQLAKLATDFFPQRAPPPDAQTAPPTPGTTNQQLTSSDDLIAFARLLEGFHVGI